MMNSLYGLRQFGVFLLFLLMIEINEGAESFRGHRLYIRQVEGGIHVCKGNNCAFFSAAWFKRKYPSLFYHPDQKSGRNSRNDDGDRCCPTIRSMRWLEKEEDIYGTEYNIIHIKTPPTYQHVMVGFCGSGGGCRTQCLPQYSRYLLLVLLPTPFWIWIGLCSQFHDLCFSLKTFEFPTYCSCQ